MDYFYSSQDKFASFSVEHLLVLFAYSTFAFLTYLFAKQYLGDNGKYRLGIIVALVPLIGLLARMYVEYRMGEFSYLEDLPLFVCRLVSFILPIMFILKSKSVFGVMYFWVMAGTMNAVITPDIKIALPHFESIFYWLIHCGLIMSILYAVFIFNWKPRKRDIWRAFWWANAYLIIVHSINWCIGSNYSYTMHKPQNGSILDLFGPWPLYLLTGQFIALALFWLFYLPFSFNKNHNPNN